MMQDYKVTSIYFSATGTTRKSVLEIAHVLRALDVFASARQGLKK